MQTTLSTLAGETTPTVDTTPVAEETVVPVVETTTK